MSLSYFCHNIHIIQATIFFYIVIFLKEPLLKPSVVLQCHYSVIFSKINKYKNKSGERTKSNTFIFNYNYYLIQYLYNYDSVSLIIFSFDNNGDNNILLIDILSHCTYTVHLKPTRFSIKLAIYFKLVLDDKHCQNCK